MNVKNNKRRRKSREMIEKAFMELIEQKDFHHITISDICQNAQVNRSTFYSNYLDIFDLADQIFAQLNNELSAKFQSDSSVIDITDNTEAFFAFAKENSRIFKTFFALGYDSKIKVDYYNTQLAQKYFGNKHIDYHIEFFRCGFSAILKKWLFGGCKESPAEMAEIIKSEYKGR